MVSFSHPTHSESMVGTGGTHKRRFIFVFCDAPEARSLLPIFQKAEDRSQFFSLIKTLSGFNSKGATS
jgi:hypothetical protein